jgi:predicted nucleic acid-binding protein
MGVLIDTSILVAWERAAKTGTPASFDPTSGRYYVSVVTMSELLVGAERGRPDRRAERALFAESVLTDVVVLGIDGDIARIHARLMAMMLNAGRQTATHDLWIAATALHYDFEVWTHDAHSFPYVPALRMKLLDRP